MSIPPERDSRWYRPPSVALVGVAVVAVLGLAVAFFSILVAPLAILIAFYIVFAAWAARAT